MKILHTSDWHLGRSLYGRKRYNEFSAFLDWLANTIEQEDIDALLVAGDVFDTSTPSNRAQELYYRFLCRVSGSCCRHIVIIAGNHDSPTFLNAPRELLRALNVYVVGAMSDNPENEVIVLRNIEQPEAIVCAVPYLRDKDIRTVEPGETIDDKNTKLILGLKNHYADVCAIAEQKRSEFEKNGHPGVPIVAMGHLFTAGGKTVDGDGVRELYVGSLAHVGKDVFPSCIDYLALGHLHVPQFVGSAEHIRYSGSPIPVGYGEANQEKKVVLIEFNSTTPNIQEIPVPCFQQLVRIVGSLDDIHANLTTLDESNIIKLKSFQRSSWDETVNEVTVVCHDEVDDQDKPAVVQDLGNIQIQGRVVPKTMQMPGISNETQAIKVALREARASATPLSSVALVANRAAWALNNGDVFKLNWPKLGIADVVYRISTINEDDLSKGNIFIEAIEDVFAAPESVYSEPQVPQWVDPKSAPADVPNWEVHEATYWDVQFNLTAADIANLGATDSFVTTVAARPANDTFAYDVYARISPSSYENVGVGPFCPSAIITPALVQENDTTFAYTGGSAMSDVTVGKFAYINLEIVKVTVVNLGAATVTVARGILDTTPIAYTAGSRIYFAEDRQGVDRTERAFAEPVDVKLLPQTPLGVLPEGSATKKSWFMNQHRQRPYPPGDFRLDGSVYPATTSGDIVVSWNHRDKTQQLAYLVEQDEANIGPETNVDYFVRFYDNGVQVHDSGSVAGTQYVYTQAQRIIDFGGVGPHTVECRLWAKNDTLSLNSRRFHGWIFTANDI